MEVVFLKGFLGKISMLLLIVIAVLAFYSFVLEPESLTVKYLKLSKDKDIRVLFFSDPYKEN